ncbi:MAG: dockerin type I domain-containing protein, partial [Aeoliella sp.]
MKILNTLTGCLLLTALATSAQAVVIVDEDFESYASDAAFHVNWVGNDGGPSPGTPAEVEDQFQLISLSPPNADFNGDNIVNALDYVRWRDNLGTTGTGTQMTGDANGDSNVDNLDYSEWVMQFGGPPPVGGGQAVERLINYVNTDPNMGPTRVPDGVVEYQPVLNPNNTEDGSVFPTEAEPVVAKVDIFVDTRETETFWPRHTLGLRNVFGGTTLDIVEIGIYNDDSAFPGFESRGFATRVQLWQVSGGATNPNWQYFELDPSYD